MTVGWPSSLCKTQPPPRMYNLRECWPQVDTGYDNSASVFACTARKGTCCGETQDQYNVSHTQYVYEMDDDIRDRRGKKHV